MRRPCARGTLLALTLTLALTLGFPIDLGPEALLAGRRFALALAVMLVPGAFLAALPGRLRHRERARIPVRWQRCLLAFLGGLAVTVGCGLDGGGAAVLLFTGPAVGSLGGWAFLLAALVVGWIVARLTERGHAG